MKRTEGPLSPRLKGSPGLLFLYETDREARALMGRLAGIDEQGRDEMYLVVLKDANGRCWNGQDGLQVVPAMSHADAVDKAWPDPPSTREVHMAHCWKVAETDRNQHYRRTVTVPKPKWTDEGGFQ
jgi:hypothetical protein